MIQLPKNLDECLDVLMKHYETGGWEQFKQMDEEEATSICHHTTGRSIRNDWKLWDENSELHKWFKSIGAIHADDMSSIILTSFHRKLNGKDIDLNSQIEFYKTYWKNNEKQMKVAFQDDEVVFEVEKDQKQIKEDVDEEQQEEIQEDANTEKEEPMTVTKKRSERLKKIIEQDQQRHLKTLISVSNKALNCCLNLVKIAIEEDYTLSKVKEILEQSHITIEENQLVMNLCKCDREKGEGCNFCMERK